MSTVNPVAGSASARPPSMNALPVGTRIGDFEIASIIGEGGFGIVYEAFDHSLHRRIALKEYMPSALASRRGDQSVAVRSAQYEVTFRAGLKSFVNEARLLAQFDHPALVKVFRFWEQNETAYMVMPLYEGRTLKDVLRENPAPDEGWLMALLSPLLDALETLHNAQCYHRDIAPDNILILKNGAPLLLDFGAARRIIGDMTQAVTVILKPGYAPIEQYADDATLRQGPWTDIYALSAVLCLAVVGKAPATSVTRMVSDPMRPLAETVQGYSQEFLRGLDRGLAVRPEDRPQSIAEFRAMLGIRTMAPPPPMVTTMQPAGSPSTSMPRTAQGAMPRTAGGAMTGMPQGTTRAGAAATMTGATAMPWSAGTTAMGPTGSTAMPGPSGTTATPDPAVTTAPPGPATPAMPGAATTAMPGPATTAMPGAATTAMPGPATTAMPGPARTTTMPPPSATTTMPGSGGSRGSTVMPGVSMPGEIQGGRTDAPGGATGGVPFTTAPPPAVASERFPAAASVPETIPPEFLATGPATLPPITMPPVTVRTTSGRGAAGAAAAPVTSTTGQAVGRREGARPAPAVPAYLAPSGQGEKRSSTGLIIGGIAAVAVVGLVVSAYFGLRSPGNGADKRAKTDTAIVTPPSPDANRAPVSPVSPPAKEVAPPPAPEPPTSTASTPASPPAPVEAPPAIPSPGPSATQATSPALPVPSGATGRVTVNVKPWGEVFVEGKSRGIGTSRTLVLPEGTYRIEVRNPSGPAFRQDVEVKAGKPVTIDHAFN